MVIRKNTTVKPKKSKVIFEHCYYHAHILFLNENGQYHRIFGPACIEIYDNYIEETFWINGVNTEQTADIDAIFGYIQETFKKHNIK